MSVYDFSELFEYAKLKSPYYRDLFKNYRPHDPELPIVNSKTFWRSNSLKNNEVLTSPWADGTLFKSGGTTGSPKFSFFLQEEWETFTQIFGQGMRAGGLYSGERVANLFYAGDLYASFLFIMRSIENSGSGAIHLPISGNLDPATIIAHLQELAADAIAGVPTTILLISDWLKQNELKMAGVKRILFGGESMYIDLRQDLKEVFPNAEIQSIGYASVDAGLLGFVRPHDDPDIHRTFVPSTIFQIVDPDTGLNIEEPGIDGEVVISNLTRRLMPILRYPAGDRAIWLEENVTGERRYRITGRSEDGARVGPANVYYEDVQAILHGFKDRIGSILFQFQIHHFLNRDQLTVVLSSEQGEFPQLNTSLNEALLTSRPMLKDLLDKNQIHPVKWHWVERHQLSCNPRTGKLKRVIDERKPEASAVNP